MTHNGGVSDHPELDEYEPHGDRSLWSKRRQRIIQVGALVGIALLVLPLVISQQSLADRSAQRWCAIWVAYELSEPATPLARFQVFGPSGLGWECYATTTVGGDRYLGPLGIIPGPPNLADGRVLMS